MVGSLAVALLFPQAVALPAQAMRLDALLRHVTTESGEVHRASGPVAGRIVLVAGTARPIGPLRVDLAKAVWGTWRRVGSEWNLEEDREAVKVRVQARLDKRIEVIGKAQREMLAKASTVFDLTQAKALRDRLEKADAAMTTDRQKGYQAWSAVQDAAPSTAALRRIVASLDTKALAAQEGVVVYSDRPNRLQRPLPRAGIAAIRQLERDQSVWAEVHTDDQTWRNDRGSSFTADMRNYAAPARPGSYRLVLRTQEDGGGGAIECTAWFLDQAGRIRQFAQFDLPLTGTWRELSEAPKADPTEGPISLSAESIAHARALKFGATGAMGPLVIAPDRRDPLDFTAAEACRALARARNTALVAWLPDRLISYEAQMGSKPEIVGPSPSEWVRELWVRSVDTLTTADSIVLRPRALLINVDRRTLATLLQATDRAGFPSLDAISTYAASRDDTSMDEACLFSLEATLPQAIELVFSTDWKTLSLWGGFTLAQRAALRRSEILSWGTLSSAQRDRLMGAILNSPMNEIRSTGRQVSGEPSELLAGGFASDGSILGVGSVEEGVYVRSSESESVYPRFASAIRLAEVVWQRERSDARYSDEFPPTLPTTYVPGRSIEFGFTMRLTPDATWGKSGRHGEFDLRAKPQPFDSLPATFRAAYEGRLRTLRAQSPRG